jgi:hypothetical protein
MGQIYQEKGSVSVCSRRTFRSELATIAPEVDWSGQGTFKGLGGEAGAKEALRILLKARNAAVTVERAGSHGR